MRNKTPPVASGRPFLFLKKGERVTSTSLFLNNNDAMCKKKGEAMITGTQFRRAREANGLSREEAADLFKIHEGTLYKFEAGITKTAGWFKGKATTRFLKETAGSDVVVSKTDDSIILTAFLEQKPLLGALLSKMSSAEIADLTSCGEPTVKLWIKEHGLSNKPAGKKLTAKALAQKLGV